ncbi:MAG: hypothetical protein WC898_01555 [Candidatus Paceibacterota bacterium]|jgi:hypothetical protein
MPRITNDTPRKIIEDFAREIKQSQIDAVKPQDVVIHFRNERAANFPRKVVSVPINLLRYRKDNGRIASDVYSYEKSIKVLEEEDDDDQKILEKFLKDKDPDQTQNLKNSILHQGQDDPAIITCDGFLINGNRRKMVFQLLREQTHDPKFDRMNVVILPGKNDPGGPPTNKEIEQIENRYQLQKDGKSEYSNFDRALSIRRKIESGMSLEDQLSDDPNFVSLSPSEFKKQVQKYEEEFLKPLGCVDRYLEDLGRDGYYRSISSGIGDREGRWQAFLDYYKSVRKKLENERERISLGIEEDEVGRIEDVAFKLIRLREFPGQKVHNLMRGLPKYLSDDISKDELFALNRIRELDPSETHDSDGKEDDYEIIDQKWRNKNSTEIIRRVRRAIDHSEHSDEMETPIELLKQALKKLEHRKMNPSSIGAGDLKEAMIIAEKVERKARELKTELYNYIKDIDKLKKPQNKHTNAK